MISHSIDYSIRDVPINVSVSVGNVVVAGRSYKVSHVIMYGQSRTYIELKPYSILINAVYNTLPFIHYTRSELILLKQEEDFENISRAVSILKCEVDNSITAKIGCKEYKLQYVKVYTEKPVIVNAIIFWPLLLSILSLKRDIEVKTQIANDKAIFTI